MKTTHLAGALSPFWIVGLMACFSFKPTADQVCTNEKATSLGVKHGVHGVQPMKDVASVCAPEVQGEIGAHYLTGHREGRAAILERERARVCGYNQAYKLGMNHGRGGSQMSLTLFDICDPSSRPESEQGYRTGYAKGVEIRPTPTAPSGPGLNASTSSQTPSCSSALGSRCVMRLKVKDSCFRGRPLEYRFFNPDRNLVFPSNKQVFVSRRANNVSSHDIQCRVGERLCYGAQSGQSYWGTGLQGGKNCQDCCVICGPGEAPIWNIGC